jgi:hypothetical protein
MSRKAKIVVGVVAGLLAACQRIFGTIYSLMMGYFPTVSEETCDYDKPIGFSKI